MALKQSYDKLEDVPEALRGEYTEQNGKFVLQVEGAEDVTGLKNTVSALREEKRQMEAQVATWKKLGKTPEEIAALVAEADQAREEKARREGDFDAILTQKQQQWEADKARLEATLAEERAATRTAIVNEAVVAELAKAGATVEGTEFIPDRLRNRIDVRLEDGRRVVRILQADGKTVMAGSAGDGTATIGDLVAEAKTKWPALFRSSGAGGSGKQPEPGAGGSVIRSKADLKTEADRAKYVRENGLAAYQALPTR